jgi:heme/copper-type cytochrome/quinol oxidase subunit 2
MFSRFGTCSTCEILLLIAVVLICLVVFTLIVFIVVRMVNRNKNKTQE